LSDKSAKMLERVRALLAKAASTNFPAEADTFRAKADEIMTEYAIDQWMVDQAQNGNDARPEPVRRDMDVAWRRGNPFSPQLMYMFGAVAEHCRCMAPGYMDYENYTKPVFGIPSDLDWFDLLFTQLMIAMIQQVDPQPKADMTLMENLAMMREAGMPWDEAINRIIKAGEVADVVIDEGATFEDVYKPWVHAYRRWCRDTGHPQSYVNQRTYREHFADGFSDEIWDRLYRMRRETEQNYDASHSAGSMALAVRDITDMVKERMYADYPNLRPHPPGCDCDQCHICNDPECQRIRCVNRRKPVKLSHSSRAQPKINYEARQAGRAAGKQVNISNNPSERLGNKRALES